MKKILITLSAIFLVGILTYILSSATNLNSLINPGQSVNKKDEYVSSYDSYLKFSNDLGSLISANTYDTIFENGSLGKYGISPIALKDLGLNYNVDAFDFVDSENLQEEAFKALCSLNKFRLAAFIEKYDGTIVNGIRISESGIIAAAHIVGPEIVKKWLKGEFPDKTLQTGNKLSVYISAFGFYDLEYIPAVRDYHIQ